MIKNKLYIGLAFISFVALNCTKEKAEQKVEVESSCDSTISFAQEINALIIAPNCNTSGCHADGAGSLTFDSHTVISDNADLIYNVMSHAPGALQMPYPVGSDKLADSLIAQFKCWIDSGKLDN